MKFPILQARALAVASDGALWYSRLVLGSIVGRIAGNVATEFRSPTQSWSLASAGNGEMWVLGNGFGLGLDSAYRMTPAGAVTALPIGYDTLFGSLQSLPDGTLYIGTGITQSLLRLETGGQIVKVADLPEIEYLSDSAGNLWFSGTETLGYLARSGAPNFSVTMPGDPRDCSDTPVYSYKPMAIDSTGGLWVRVVDETYYFPGPIPCEDPDPEPMPDLIRIDTAQFLARHIPGHAVPTLSTVMLAALGVALALATIWRLRA